MGGRVGLSVFVLKNALCRKHPLVELARFLFLLEIFIALLWWNSTKICMRSVVNWYCRSFSGEPRVLGSVIDPDCYNCLNNSQNNTDLPALVHINKYFIFFQHWTLAHFIGGGGLRWRWKGLGGKKPNWLKPTTAQQRKPREKWWQNL